MDKYIGKRLDGRYEIHELLGVGGMAYVYKAYDNIEKRWVAIKILKEELAGNSDFLRRFRNESKAIAVLSHPNIVKVYDVSFGDRIQYIVMEYIDGITLKQYIEQQGEIKWREALYFTVQILRALQHAHEKGIIHRDIKPQNIMLLEDGTIKVTDFGIARFSQAETQTMTDKAIGSVHYIAPEQARGGYINDKADIYSVGVMLYEMLTGQLPFVADNAVSVAIMQMQAEPTPPSRINPSIPKGLEEITMHAMEKNPAQRFPSQRICWRTWSASAATRKLCSATASRLTARMRAPLRIFTATCSRTQRRRSITTTTSMKKNMCVPKTARALPTSSRASWRLSLL